MWLGPCTSDWSIQILRESKGGRRGQSIPRTNWFPGAFEKLRLVLGVINVKCKAQLMGLKPVFSFLKQMSLIKIPSSYAAGYWLTQKHKPFVPFKLILLFLQGITPNLRAACKRYRQALNPLCPGAQLELLPSLVSLRNFITWQRICKKK